MKNFMSTDFSIQSVFLACYVPKDAGILVHSHRPNHGLALHLSGNKNYRFEKNGTLNVHGNEIIYLPQHSDYVVEHIESGDCYAINFDLNSPFAGEPFVFKVKNTTLFTESFRKAENLWHEKSVGYALKVKSLLYDILYRMQTEYASRYLPEQRAALIAPAIEYIHSTYTESGIAIGTLAERCGISETYFRRLFRSVYGTSPIQYINALRFTRAAELLNSKLYSVREVMALSGFEDEAYFSRAFKKYFDISPKDFANGSKDF